MKKIFLLALLLGLTGCGNDNQNGASQADSSSGLGGQTVAKTMSASSLSLGGWTVTNTSASGASTLLEAAKDTRVSAALITPNATDVAKVLRGGAAGIALSLAVDQILGAVDWVLDPANNRIVYRNNPSSCELDHTCFPPNVIDYYYFNDYDANSNLVQRQYSTALEACNGIRNRWGGLPVIRTDLDWDNSGPLHKCVVYGDGSYQYIVRAAVNADHQTLSLDVVAEQVISKAEDEDLDAQVATNAAVQAILTEASNDAVKAQPIVDQFENNADNKCESGIVSTLGQCWVCPIPDYLPVTNRTKFAKAELSRLGRCLPEMTNTELFTRINVFNEFVQARVNENSCWAPLHLGHVKQEQDGRNGVIRCTGFLK